MHVLLIALWVATQPLAPVGWETVLDQPAEWYGSVEARRIAGNLLLYQRNSGGWPKNVDMARPLTAAERTRLERDKQQADGTIDNGATWRQMRFLARVIPAAQDDRFTRSFLAGLDFLLAAEHPRGGWPQIYPLRKDYSRHITFNDGASINVAALLRDVATTPPFIFVDEARRTRAAAAVDRAIAMILAAQIRVDGRLTAWCAQHDEATLAPRPARSYEPASLSGKESVEIVEFLLTLSEPSPAVVAAIEHAVDWLRRVQITGRRLDRISAPALTPSHDIVVRADPSAPPLWARFYEIGTNRPMFLGRDGIVRYDLASIEHERRTGYSWLGPYAAELLAKQYPAWQARRRRG